MKLVVLDAQTLGEDMDLSVFQEFGELIVYETTFENEKFERVRDVDIVITNKVVFDRKLIQKLPNLKLIALTATGMNNVDLDAAKEFGIIVKNVAGYSTKSVAQHTFSMALHVINRLSFYDAYVKSGKWCESKVFTNLDMPFFEIYGKKWGIVGLGTIGREVAKIAKAFGAKVAYYSTSGVCRKEKYPQQTLEVILETSDIISIHAPLNDNTRDLIGAKELSSMKQDAIIINVGRGGIIDEKALKEAVENEKIYACIDVLSSEPMQKDSPLSNLKHKDRILITPHVAWGSVEARIRLIELVYKNIMTFVKKGV